jgi:hypothetical protein
MQFAGYRPRSSQLMPITHQNRAMPGKHRAALATTRSSKSSVEDEIAHLRDLGLKGLRARWQSVFQRPPHPSCRDICCLRSWLFESRLIVMAISIVKPERFWIAPARTSRVRRWRTGRRAWTESERT